MWKATLEQHLEAAQIERGRVATGPRDDVRQPARGADQHRRAVRRQPRHVCRRIPAIETCARSVTEPRGACALASPSTWGGRSTACSRSIAQETLARGLYAFQNTDVSSVLQGMYWA